MKGAQRKRERAKGQRDRHKNHRKRVRHYGGNYEPVRPEEIFERDGWKCQICGKAIRRDTKCPHPLSASIDHIIPVSEGGDHVAENLRAAHFGCNTARGTGKNEAVQLALL